ncbi:helix-turn-helix domain-containing protein [Roseateles sp. So40a]|uniref:helix-turn-helix domain-containing protein n=1 Tax=Roseateles sp. So40a TaxID=3400226 RepID=UPI003A8BB9F4
MRKRKSQTLENVLAWARRFNDHGLMSDEKRREFERICCPLPEFFPPEEIRRIREVSDVDVHTMARLLNTTHRLVKRWEEGLARPRGPELKLLQLVRDRGVDTLCGG